MNTFKNLIDDNIEAFESIDSDLLNIFVSKFGDEKAEDLDTWYLYQELDHNGELHGLIDGKIDIYYYDLRRWAVDNYESIESAMEEGLCEGEKDFHKLIQAGQYYFYNQQMNEEVAGLVELINSETQRQSNEN